MTRAAIAESVAGSLAGRFRGQVLEPGQPAFEQSRRVWNAMIDRHPAVIVRPVDAKDVAAAVEVATSHVLPVGVRCGGHSVAGKSTCDDGLLVDLSLMRSVVVDEESRTARVGGGVLWGELDRMTQASGLATPGGRVTTTGVGGFTLGGGYGWLSPKFGLACDNLIGAELVTADGRIVTASEHVHEDLLWGLRGGGGNFGIVTSYRFRLHAVGPTIVGGMLLHPLDQATEVLRGYRDIVESGPDELATAFAFFVAPPEPFIPEYLHGRTVLGILCCCCDDVDAGLAVVRPLKALGRPAVDAVGPITYVELQALLDPTAPPGWRWYNTGEHLRALSDDAIDTLTMHAPQGLALLTQTIVFRHGGAVSRIGDDATAFGNRNSAYLLHPLAGWTDPAEDGPHIAWLRALVSDMEPFKTGGVYLNFSPDADDQVPEGYGKDKYARLVALKNRYDPANVFRFNHNIRPVGAS